MGLAIPELSVVRSVKYSFTFKGVKSCQVFCFRVRQTLNPKRSAMNSPKLITTILARTADGSSSVSARKPDIPSEEDCLGAIVQVARLVAMGLLETAQANAIRAAFREILLYHRNKSKEAEKGISNVELLDVLRKDPKLLSLFEPLLSQEQVEWILRAGDSDGEDAA